MRKLHTPSVLKSTASQMKSKVAPPKKDVEDKPRPKIASVTIVKSIVNPSDEVNFYQIEYTILAVEDFPEDQNSAELVVVMSPTDDQPSQAPPFQKTFSVVLRGGGIASLNSGALSFRGGLEPPTGNDQYHLNLVQDVATGEVWDIEDADVNVVIIPDQKVNDVKTLAANFLGDDKKPRPKIASVTIVKTINDDITVSQVHQVNMDIQDLPSSITGGFNLKVTMTNNGSNQPAQAPPLTATFTLEGASTSRIEGILTFAGGTEMEVENNAYTLNSVIDQTTQKTWEILNSSIPVVD